MTWKARIYLLAVYVLGLTITIFAFSEINKNILLTILIWIIIATPFEIRPIRITTDLQHTLSFAIHLSLLIIYGPWVAIVVATFVTVIADLIEKKGITKLIFNVSQFSITLYIAGAVFSLFKKSNIIFLVPDDILAFICAAGLYVFTNLFLVAAIVALTQKRSVFYVLKWDLKMVFLHFTTLAPLSMLMVLLYKEQPLTMILIVPPLVLAHTSFRSYASLKIETRKTLETLADFVDCRDHYTAEHSKRVAEYANAIAEEMGMQDADKELIELAGRVHDLGKISISDSLLLKCDTLTDEEMKAIKSHPDVAYNILKSLNMYKTGSIIVKQHHERYDGLGYPQGLKDKNIHIGARIIAVADAFDAMTSDRPYRKAMSEEEAISELKINAGKQFDPAVVNAFLKVLSEKRNQLGVS